MTDNRVADTEGLITQSQVTNTPATGEVRITGSPQVGHTLIGKARNVRDENGVQALYSHQTTASWQWFRVDPMTLVEEQVSSVPSYAWRYEVTIADRGKAIQARVSFLDDGGSTETLRSALQLVTAPPNTVGTATPVITGSPALSEAGSDGAWSAGEKIVPAVGDVCFLQRLH